MVEALYIHIPFCVSKCYYCDFNSYVAGEEVRERFLGALEADLARLAACRPDVRLRSVYFGGGTPSMLTAPQWDRILSVLHRRFRLEPDVEITVEVNPGTADREKLRAMIAGGVNRLSFGVQAFQPRLLRLLGRSHGVDEIYESYRLARGAGEVSVNFDLMFGLPDQTMADWRESLREALSLGPDHLSAYGLKIEEGTPYARWHEKGFLHLPPEELEVRMYEELLERTAACGYEHYEISNFARPGARCRHNEVYWRNEPYLAAGPGAHGYADGVRYALVRDVPEYMDRLAKGEDIVEERRVVDLREAMEDEMILGLRLLEGVDDRVFRRRYGRSMFDVFAGPISEQMEKGMLIREGERVRLTAEALWVSNEVFQSFLS